MDNSSLCNKLGALSQAINDAALASADDLAPTAISALITLRDREPLSIGEIAHIVGLTHSAAVRLVDRLEKDWLVRRQRRVGREVMVEITARGRRRSQQLQEARLEAVRGFLAALDPEGQSALDGLIDRIVEARRPDGLDVERHCRSCSRRLCHCGLHPDAR